MARIHVDRNELKAIIPALKRALPKSGPYKSTMAGMVEASIIGQRLSLTTSDVETTLTVSLNGSGGTGSVGMLIPIKALSDFARSATDSWITLDMHFSGETPIAILDGEHCTTHMEARTMDEWPVIPRGNGFRDDERSYFPQADLIRDSLAFVSLAASSDPTRYNLHSVYVDTRCGESASNLPDTLPRFVSTDGHRLHTDEMPMNHGTRIPEHAAPMSAVRAMIDAMGKGKKSAQSAEWGRNGFSESRATHVFRCERAITQWEVAYCEIEGDFPNWRQVFPNVLASCMGAESDDITRACDSIVKSNEKGKPPFAAFEISETGGTLTGRDLSVSRFHADGAQQKWGVNASYLRDALTGFKGKRVSLRHAGEWDAVGNLMNPIRIDATGTRAAVVMPTRL